jgi:PAS domain S-box-containing protein
MAKNNKAISGITEKLYKENEALRQQLQEARAHIAAIKTGNIDALVLSGKEDIKVYTEETSDKIYRILIEEMHEGAVTLNEHGTILYCNSYFANMVKLPLQKITGTNFGVYIDFSKERFEAFLKQGSENAIREEVQVCAAGGTTIPVLLSANALSLNNNFVLSIILTDLTIQNKNQEELKQRTTQLEQKNIELEDANKDLISFTYVSSHDLQEPLRKIQNFVSCILLEEETNLSETGKGYFRKMMQTAKRMQALIEDLLIYSGTRNSDREFEKTNLDTLVAEVAIEVANLGELSIIRFQFRQLLHNLISNSLKFSAPETVPHIIIKSEIVRGSMINTGGPALTAGRLSSKTDYCHITYTDNGIGFDPQYSERIFEVFQRLHSQDKYKGTGIGLAICKRVIENHHGIITASGKANMGARFDIYVPVL